MPERTLDILIVEPERDLGALVRMALADYKLKVNSVSSAVEAKSTLIQNIPDLVLCDLSIGENSTAGAMLCVELGSHPNFAALPVLLAADDVTEQTKSTAASSGAAGVVCKPLEEEEFRASVEQILGLSVSQTVVDVNPPLKLENIDTAEPVPTVPSVVTNPVSAPSRPVEKQKEVLDNVKAAQLILAKVLHSLKRGKELNVVDLEKVPEVVLEETRRVCQQEARKFAPAKEEEVNVDLSSVLIK